MLALRTGAANERALGFYHPLGFRDEDVKLIKLLEGWFRNQPSSAEQIELIFDQVKAILGSPLPKSATKLTTWWTNVTPKIQNWLEGGGV
jgi:hypothetical protein